MTQITTGKRHGATLRVQVDNMPSCCGVAQLAQFRVLGSTAGLDAEKLGKLYDELWYLVERELANNFGPKGVVLATDALPDTCYDPDFEGSWGNIGADRDFDEVSMANFCRHMEFQEGGHGYNGNTSNAVAVFSKVLRPFTVDCDEAPRPVYKMPDYPVDPNALTDKEEVLKQIRELARGAS